MEAGGTVPKLAQDAGQCEGGEAGGQPCAGGREGINPSGLCRLRGGRGHVPGEYRLGMDLRPNTSNVPAPKREETKPCWGLRSVEGGGVRWASV